MESLQSWFYDRMRSLWFISRNFAECDSWPCHFFSLTFHPIFRERVLAAFGDCDVLALSSTLQNIWHLLIGGLALVFRHFCLYCLKNGFGERDLCFRPFLSCENRKSEISEFATLWYYWLRVSIDSFAFNSRERERPVSFYRTSLKGIPGYTISKNFCEIF